ELRSRAIEGELAEIGRGLRSDDVDPKRQDEMEPPIRPQESGRDEGGGGQRGGAAQIRDPCKETRQVGRTPGIDEGVDAVVEGGQYLGFAQFLNETAKQRDEVEGRRREQGQRQAGKVPR